MLLHNLAVYLTKRLTKSNAILEEDEDIYVYGWEMILSTASSLITILLISLMVGQFLGSVCFLICFLTLRSYAGGYHSNTYLGCYLTMLVIYILINIVIFIYPQEFILTGMIISALISTILVLLKAPQDHPNRPIEGEEIPVFKKRSRLILLAQICIITLLTLLFPSAITTLFWGSLGTFVASLFLLIPSQAVL